MPEIKISAVTVFGGKDEILRRAGAIVRKALQSLQDKKIEEMEDLLGLKENALIQLRNDEKTGLTAFNLKRVLQPLDLNWDAILGSPKFTMEPGSTPNEWLQESLKSPFVPVSPAGQGDPARVSISLEAYVKLRAIEELLR